jgi:hypothetical protein
LASTLLPAAQRPGDQARAGTAAACHYDVHWFFDVRTSRRLTKTAQEQLFHSIFSSHRFVASLHRIASSHRFNAWFYRIVSSHVFTSTVNDKRGIL